MGNQPYEPNIIGLTEGEGYRILEIKQKSILEGKVTAFFDFIVDVFTQSQKSGKKTLQQVVIENINKTIGLRVLSTKYRETRTISVMLDQNNIQNDSLGVIVRKQRYQEALETYMPVKKVLQDSVADSMGISSGQFLIGCRELMYCSIEQFIEKLYEFFHKGKKIIHLAMYKVDRDDLRVLEIQLGRGTGKGMLGCTFDSSNLDAFPKVHNIPEVLLPKFLPGPKKDKKLLKKLYHIIKKKQSSHPPVHTSLLETTEYLEKKIQLLQSIVSEVMRELNTQQ